MSLTESPSSIRTLTPTRSIVDHSNELDDYRENFPSIFSNESRFLDTSLRLFKSYLALGYISRVDFNHDQDDLVSSLTVESRGKKSGWSSRLLHFHNKEKTNGSIRAFLTPTLLRKRDRSSSIYSNVEFSVKQIDFNTTKSTKNVVDDDEPQIIITRL